MRLPEFHDLQSTKLVDPKAPKGLGEPMDESLMALGRSVKVSSVPELSEIEDIEGARAICAKCPYSEL